MAAEARDDQAVTLDILTYNVSLFTDSMSAFKWEKGIPPLPDELLQSEKKRAKRINDLVRTDLSADYDVLLLQEAFSKRGRRVLVQGTDPILGKGTKGLGSKYPHRAGPTRARTKAFNGGLFILSKYPFEAENGAVWRKTSGECGGYDCQAAKGILYVAIEKDGTRFHLFNTHLDSWSGGCSNYTKTWPTRKTQLIRLDDFIGNQNIPENEPVIVAGDMNIYGAKGACSTSDGYTRQYQGMLSLLDASALPVKDSGRRANLDHVLYSKEHGPIDRDQSWYQLLSLGRSLNPSDHTPVHGHIVTGGGTPRSTGLPAETPVLPEGFGTPGAAAGAMASYSAMSPDEFVSRDRQLFDEGKRLVDLERVGRSFAAVWQDGEGAQRWHAGLSASQLERKDEEYFESGYRMVDLEAGADGYTAVWRAGQGAQRVVRGRSWDELSAETERSNDQGLRLVDVEIHDGSYAAIWRAGQGVQWLHRGLSYQQLLDQDAEYLDQGLRLVDVEGTANGYLAVWRAGDGVQWWRRTMSLSEFTSAHREYARQGLAPVDIEILPEGYLAVWRPAEGDVEIQVTPGSSEFTSR